MASKKKRKGKVRRGNKVVIYIRVSDTTGREESLISDEVQLNECMRLVKQHGFEVVETITELDKTGREYKKRAISKIIDRVRDKEIDGVLVWKISRWGRNTIDSMLNLGELEDAGGFIMSASENIDEIDTPVGKFNLTILLAIAQLYSDEIGKTWANIHDYRREQGKTHNGTPRLGYIALKHIPEEEREQYNVIEGCDYVVDPVKGPWVRKAYESYVAGTSLTSIVSMLDEAGVRSTRDKRITYKSLLATLDGGFAAGYVVDRREEEEKFVRGKQEPLISEATWTKYQKRRREKVHPRVKTAPYLLQGLLRCAACGSAMLVSNTVQGANGPLRYFKCSRSNTVVFSKGCEAPATGAESAIEAALFDWVTDHATGQSALDTAQARAQAVKRAEKDSAKIAREIERLNTRLGILYDDKVKGEVSPHVYKMKEAEMLAELEALQGHADAATTTLEINALPPQTAFGALILGWDKMPPEILNRAVKTVVQRIEITRPDRRGGRSRIRVVGAWEPPLRLAKAAG